MRLSHCIALALCLALATAPALSQDAAGDADARAVALAKAVLDHMEAGDFEGATSDFNAQMQAGLGPRQLADVQGQIEATGPVLARGEPQVLHHDGFTVVVFRIQREQASLEATVAIDGDGKVGGLHFVPADTDPR